tara:strand:- start:5599 stop:7800 length:2202 start_codon:yes stop_codon:yes gene_type:complete
MAVALLSPGVLTREVDLTVGRAENVLDNIGAIAGPFTQGPVNEPILIQNEQELINTFGKPVSTDAQYEYWMSASSFLSYGGIIKVVRAGATTLSNANAGVAATNTSGLQVYNYEDYVDNHQTDTSWFWAAKNPGSWSNGLKVCVIDDAADQIIGIATTSLAGAGATIGYGVTTALSAVSIPKSDGTVETFTGYLKGIITGLSTDATNSASKINVKIVSRVSAAGTETAVSYEKGGTFKFDNSDSIYFVNNSAANVTGDDAASVRTINSEQDWYDQQQLGITNGTVYWNSIAPKPTASAYVTDRDGKNDGIHVVVVDDNGEVTGIKGNVLEKHLDLSKALDAVSAAQAPLKTYYKNYIADFSEYVFAGFNPSVSGNVIQGTEPQVSGFTTSYTKPAISNGSWGRKAQGNTFNVLGNVTYSIGGGVDYTAAGGMTAELSDQITAYNYFRNKDEEEVDYLIMGPGMSQEGESKAKAARLISIAGERKDCVAVISPHRGNIVGQTNSTTMTNNVLGFFNSLPSSSYAIFDSGYKYMFDRFNNEFRYVPCNADIAGLMVRTNINFYPWFSPAGQQRGILNDAIKLTYNPTQAERDQLYKARINPVIFQKGQGILLFGDKTGLGYASAFDRINVRRLFLTVEQALENAAKSQLFEFNDEITRANFINIVEPYLRDVQSKRGLFDFLVICDETNNTPDVIDNNEFRADIFLKPTKSINFVSLTFVATRTGVSFEEVAGRV